MEIKKNIMEEAKSVENKGRAVCSVGTICLADGPTPDFEVAGISDIFGMVD